MKFRLSKPLLLLLLLLLGGVFIGGVITNQYNVLNFDSIFCSKNKFQYINKELACGSSLVVRKHAYGELKSKIENLIQSKIIEKEVVGVSIYFRDLKNGPTLGIDEHVNFAPASLLKVPLLMTYLSLAEDQPELLNKKLKYHTLKEIFLQQLVPPKNSIKENTSYTIDELLKYMIVYSDNNAYFTLVQYLNQTYPGNNNPGSETMKDLGIIDPQKLSDDTITVKSYASIFVQLYNATFLRYKESSEKALALLSGVDYKDGLVAGIPTEVRVAHKFGERVLEGSIKQLHDCGIIYYPDNPYLLCVMTRGQDFDKLPGIISTISKMFYEEVNSRKI